MSYTYINGVYEVTTPIHKGFKRFHSMNAQYSFEHDDDFNADSWDFVSYAMPIMTVYHEIDSGMWYITIAYDALIQSRSTNRQISRFLNEIGAPVTICDLRDLIDSGFANKYDFANNRIIYVRGEVNSLFTVAFYN